MRDFCVAQAGLECVAVKIFIGMALQERDPDPDPKRGFLDLM